MGIVVVFFIGLAKLWATNRHMRRLEALDAEKQARAAQMRKSGLPPNASSRFRPGAAGETIPFGVKALEAGVEVEGIWVARMASMATRPPERKWNSRRKVKAGASPSPAALVEMNDLGGGGPSKRAWRGSRRASVISRREILEPSGQTRDKLENLSLLEEEERRSRELTGKDRESRLLMETIDDGQPRASHHGHRGALGKIQRGLKKMTSSETWHDQEKHQAGGGRLDAKEFHEKSQAKKPQRFYPTSTPPKSATTTTAAPGAPQAKSQAARQNASGLSGTQGLKPLDKAPADAQDDGRPHTDARGQSLAARKANALQQRASTGSTSSAESFVTTIEGPRDPPRRPRDQPSQHTGESSDGGGGGGGGLRQRPDISPRRSSLRQSQSRGDRRSSEGRGSLDRTSDAAHAAAGAGPGTRYPPNSSRSAPATRRRSNSSTQQQQDQPQAGSTPPNPTVGLGEV